MRCFQRHRLPVGKLVLDYHSILISDRPSASVRKKVKKSKKWPPVRGNRAPIATNLSGSGESDCERFADVSGSAVLCATRATHKAFGSAEIDQLLIMG